MKEPWSIKSRSKTCAASEEPFEEGEKIRAAIFPDPESSGYLRKDYKIDAWEKRDDGEDPFSTWLTTYQAPVIDEKPEAVVQDDPEILLGKLIEEDEPHTENARYILAVMLERQKLLKETDKQDLPTGILRVYEHRKTGYVYIVKDPQIPLSDVEKVQEEVRNLLDPQPDPDPEDEGENELQSEKEVAAETPDEEIEGNDEPEDKPEEPKNAESPSDNSQEEADQSEEE